MKKERKFKIAKLPGEIKGRSMKLAGLIIGGGILVGGGLIAGSRAVRKLAAGRFGRKRSLYEEIEVYTVETDGQSREGLSFTAGEQFIVLEVHGDAAVIEKLGDNSGSYLVSSEYLSTISNYEPVSLSEYEPVSEDEDFPE